ncbi:hypothetical protein JWR97_20765 [Pseudomonas cedrina subsp. fulgida]|nr:hypothetical protein [Pseudomonas cedrina subsp. fulgida]
MSINDGKIEITKPWGPEDTTWHSGYNKNQEADLRAYYQNTVLRHIISMKWDDKSQEWKVNHVSLEAWNSKNYK